MPYGLRRPGPDKASIPAFGGKVSGFPSPAPIYEAAPKAVAPNKDRRESERGTYCF